MVSKTLVSTSHYDILLDGFLQCHMDKGIYSIWRILTLTLVVQSDFKESNLSMWSSELNPYLI